MKRILTVLVCLLLLTGCVKKDAGMEKAYALRQRLQAAESCSFDAVITADYVENIYTFGMHCTMDRSGTVSFTVTSPETIQGIMGSFDAEGGKLTFDGQILAFEKMADRQITPVSAPWILLHTLRSGYLSSCAETEDGYQLVIDDSYEEDALQLDIWMDKDFLPKEAEILWQGRRILSLSISNFVLA